MSKKKLISFLVPTGIIIAICLSTSTSFIARTYTGFLINTKNKKILKTYPIKISGTYQNEEESKFNGYLFLDGERYYLTGNNISSDNTSMLTFNTRNKIGHSYTFNSCANLNEDDNLEIHSEDPDSSTLIIASNNYKETDILDNIK